MKKRIGANDKGEVRIYTDRKYCPECHDMVKIDYSAKRERCAQCFVELPALMAVTPDQVCVISSLQDEIIRLKANRLNYLSGDLNELKETIGFQDFNIFLTIDAEVLK